jgi:hypothetical protein
MAAFFSVILSFISSTLFRAFSEICLTVSGSSCAVLTNPARISLPDFGANKIPATAPIVPQ